MIEILKALCSSAFFQIRNSFARPMFKYCILLNPVLYLYLLYMMCYSSNKLSVISVTIWGSGIMSLWSCICSSSASDIDREKNMGTLEVIYGTPIDFKIIVLGKLAGNTVLGMIPFLILVVITMLIPEVGTQISSFLIYFILLTAVGFSFLSVSYVLSAVLMLTKRASIIMNFIEYPIYILCGFIVPVQYLPSFMEPICLLLPPTWTMKLIQMMLSGNADYLSIFRIFIIIIFMSSIHFIAGILLFHIIDKNIRRKGSLGLR